MSFFLSNASQSDRAKFKLEYTVGVGLRDYKNDWPWGPVTIQQEPCIEPTVPHSKWWRHKLGHT